MLITRDVCKAARALAGWSANMLADAAGVSQDTIRSFESGRTKSLSAENQEAVQKALETQGIQFLNNGDVAAGPGVSKKPSEGERSHE